MVRRARAWSSSASVEAVGSCGDAGGSCGEAGGLCGEAGGLCGEAEGGEADRVVVGLKSGWVARGPEVGRAVGSEVGGAVGREVGGVVGREVGGVVGREVGWAAGPGAAHVGGAVLSEPASPMAPRIVRIRRSLARCRDIVGAA
ncbi:MAG: hypothetical protein AAGF11_37070 [Myxococcota bacterium]